MNLTLSRKIAGAFAVCLILVICASGFVYVSITSIKNNHLLQIERTRDSTIIAESNGLSSKIYSRYARVVLEKASPASVEEWEQIKSEVFETMMLTGKVATNDELKKSSDIMQESINAILKVVDEKVVSNIKNGDMKSVNDAEKEINNLLQKYTDESTKVNATIAAQAAHAEGQFNIALKQIIITLLGISGALVIAMVMLNIFLSRNIKKIINSLLGEVAQLKQAAIEGNLAFRGDSSAITTEFRSIISGFNESLNAILNPIEEAKRILEQMAMNNFSSEMQGDYQGDHAALKKAINKLLASLNKAFIEVNSTVEKVNAGSQQVADAGHSLSQGATESASSLEEITSTMNEIGSQTQKNAENAFQAKELSDESKKSAENGNHQMKKMTVAIDGINESSQKIAKIIKVIDEIAFQTNLLALNAAVEAARAGKHGKGFAVVAEEVRNLAARSAQAAKETNDMIADSTSRVSNGVTIAQETAKVLEEIYSSASRVTTLVGEISTASNHQAQSVNQVVTALTQIEQVTQKNTAISEESAAASRELLDQAQQLKNLVAQFNLKN